MSGAQKASSDRHAGALAKAKMEEVASKTLYMHFGGLPALRDKEFHGPVETC